MPTEWPKITASFTTEEMEIIEKVRSLLKTNKNKFVRACLITGIVYVLLNRIIQSKKTGLPKVTKPIVLKLFPEEKIEKLKIELESEMQNISRKERDKAIEEIKLLNEIQKIFQTHNPVGAPSQKCGKVGRPSKKEMRL